MARHPCTLALALVALAPGCYSGLTSGGQDGAGEDADDDADGSEGDTTDDDPPGVGCEGLRPTRAPLRRLTDVQYRNTIDDLFTGAVLPSGDFPETSLAYEYTNEAVADEITELATEEVLVAAEDVADQVMTAVDVVVGCDLSQACIEGFVDEFGGRAFRRPLAPAERTLLLAAYDEGAADSPTDGIGRLVTVALQMPQFVYLYETGTVDAEDPNVLRIDDHTLASRLSYLLWDTMPDDELRQAADAGTLRDVDTLEAQARRLLADPRADAALGRFHREWLELPALRGTEKDPTMYPQFDAAVADSMIAQFERLVGSTLRGDDPTLARLFTADTIEIDAALATIYGVEPPPSGWAEIPLDASQRGGILTTPLLLSVHATQVGSSTVHRGKMVRTRILCQEIPPPPPDAAANAPELPPDATERERAEALLENPECGVCHSRMDSIGFGFENYDAIGGWRTTYASGNAIDASGRLVAPPAGIAEQEFVGAIELGRVLADADPVSTCYVEHFLHHARGAAPSTEVERCANDDLAAAFIASGQDLPQFVADFVRSDGFRFRDVGEAE